MKRRLRVLPEAEREILAAADWYESRLPGLGVELIALVDQATERILEFPDAHPRWRPDQPHRKTLLHRFPFLVVFRTIDDAVEIVAFAHAKRRPGYWVSRG